MAVTVRQGPAAVMRGSGGNQSQHLANSSKTVSSQITLWRGLTQSGTGHSSGQRQRIAQQQRNHRPSFSL